MNAVILSNYMSPKAPVVGAKLCNSWLEPAPREVYWVAPAPRSVLGIACVLRLVFENFSAQTLTPRLIQRFLGRTKGGDSVKRIPR